METLPLRKIRSFVRREGRMSRAQQQALEKLLPVYGITDLEHPLDIPHVFPFSGPCYLEIGFGMGSSLLEMAMQHPQNLYLGIEVHRPGIGSLLLRIEQMQVNNIRVINHDAVEVLEKIIPDRSLDGVYLFFPDPWHKRKHHKRRILQPAFVDMVHEKLKPGAIFHMATDWEDYAMHMMQVMSQAPGFVNSMPPGQYADRADRPPTKYEQRGERLGHAVHDLIFLRK